MIRMTSRLAVLLMHLIMATAIDTECVTSRNCVCSVTGKDYLFHCPSDPDQLKFTIKVLQKSKVEILVTCVKSNVNFGTEYLPKIQAQAESFSFVGCSLLSNFSATIDKYGADSVRELRFDHTPDSEDAALTSDFFGNPDLETLVLRNLNLRAINEDVFTFQHSSKIKALDLSENRLRYMPFGLLRNLTELRDLNLRSNKLRVLDRNIFLNMQNLLNMDLSGNELEDLPEDVFNDLEKLELLSLDGNNLRNVSENLFSKNTDLQYVSMQGNLHLNHLPNKLFSNLTELKVVFLNQCNLSSLSNVLFDGLLHLQSIHLQNNGLERLPRDIFKDLVELQNLDLSHNKIVDLSEGLFASLVRLQTLNLEGNMLTHISENLFHNLEQLTALNLNYNKICFIESKTFVAADNLREVLLSNNCLELSENEHGLSPFNRILNLERLDLSHNNVTTIGDNWWASIREMDFSYNQITDFDITSFTGFSQLQLNVSHNRISNVNFQGVEMILRMQEELLDQSSPSTQVVVDLNGNPLQCDCIIYDFARYLDKSIDSLVLRFFGVVADNLICAAPKNLIGLPVAQLKRNSLTCTLEQVEMDSSCPENCECAFRPWDNALIVDCTNKNLTSAPELVFPNVFNKTVIYLQNNLLTTGPKRNEGYENVTELYLSSNHISEVTWIPSVVKILDLSNNGLTHLNDKILVMLNASSLTNITLGNNPWRCGCLTVNFTKWLKSHYVSKEVDVDNIKCARDGNPLINLTMEDLCPNHIRTIVQGVLVAAAITAIVIAILVTLFFSNAQAIKVWLYAHNACLWYVTEEEIDQGKKYDVFVCYAKQEQNFVSSELLPVLEQGPQPYKLCVNNRDWTPGELISKQIIRSVEESRRTLVVMSLSFLQSEWCKMEFRTAHAMALRDGRARVIVVIYGSVDLNADLDEELKAYIATNTYVRWGDRWFWDKLRYALPHPQTNR